MTHRILVNGQSADQIPISDRGLQYGDGLFETLAVVDSVPLLWARHMARLSRGERVLGLPAVDQEQLLREAQGLCHGCARGVLKIIVTRGSGGRGYRPPEKPEPRRILLLNPWPGYPEAWYRDGIRVRLCETRWSRNRRLAGVKHLNRLEQVLARQEWRDTRIAEGLMCDEQERVISATQGNLFLMRDGILLTPDLTYSGIAGVMREHVLESAESIGIPTKIADVSLEMVRHADVLFITNALLGLCPVSELEGRLYEIAGIPPALRDAVKAV